MLKSLRSNMDSFKRVDFRPGYNLILADRQSAPGEEDDSRKTRNGAGESTLMEIIHFCLGARVEKGSIFMSREFEGWSFILEFSVGNHDIEIERTVNLPDKVYFHRISSGLNWNTKYDKDMQLPCTSLSTYNEGLHSLFFGLPKNESDGLLSFRELISYFARRNTDGYQDPFRFWKSQPEHSRQACNAYFLDLNMEFVAKFQKLKEEAKSIEIYRKAVTSGMIDP